MINIKKIKKKKLKKLNANYFSHKSKGWGRKTTTVINLQLDYHNLIKKILVIIRSSGNATTGLGLSNMENSSDTIYGVLNGTKEIYQ